MPLARSSGRCTPRGPSPGGKCGESESEKTPAHVLGPLAARGAPDVRDRRGSERSGTEWGSGPGARSRTPQSMLPGAIGQATVARDPPPGSAGRAATLRSRPSACAPGAGGVRPARGTSGSPSCLRSPSRCAGAPSSARPRWCPTPRRGPTPAPRATPRAPRSAPARPERSGAPRARPPDPAAPREGAADPPPRHRSSTRPTAASSGRLRSSFATNPVRGAERPARRHQDLKHRVAELRLDHQAPAHQPQALDRRPRTGQKSQQRRRVGARAPGPARPPASGFPTRTASAIP